MVGVWLVYAWIVLLAPKSATNGFWAFFFFDELPRWVSLAAVLVPPAVVLALACSPIASRGLRERPDSSRVRRWLFTGLVALAAFCTFWTFQEWRLWGDAPTIVGIFDGRIGRGALADGLYWVHPLDYLTVIGLLKVTGALWGWSARESFALASALAGAAFVLLLLPTARRLAATAGGRAFVVAFLSSMGASQLWFGHVEHYTRVTMLMLATILAAVRYLQTGRGAWLVFLVAALSITTHPLSIGILSGLCLLPVLGPHGLRGRAGFWAMSLAPAAAYVFGLVLLSRALGAGRFQHNPWGMRFLLLPSELTFIHVWNVLQTWLLTAPLGVALVGLDVLRVRRWWKDPVFAVLLAMVAAFVPFTLLFNHGMARLREWSVFAPAALPLAVLVAYAHVRVAESGRPAVLRSVAAVALSASFAVPWIASNHLLPKRPALQVAGNESDQENIRRGILTPTRNALRP
jgi:hypothetical protein